MPELSQLRLAFYDKQQDKAGYAKVEFLCCEPAEHASTADVKSSGNSGTPSFCYGDDRRQVGLRTSSRRQKIDPQTGKLPSLHILFSTHSMEKCMIYAASLVCSIQCLQPWWYIRTTGVRVTRTRIWVGYYATHILQIILKPLAR